MNVPDELIDLYVTKYHAHPTNSANEARKAALEAVLSRHEQMVRQQIAEKAEAALEQYHMLINKMRHGVYPFGGSAADSADILDAALDQAGTEDRHG